jgi:predicted glycogen debranching enzyme
MIRGSDVGNRDTSDAPLWFFAACSDIVRFGKNRAFLKSPCGPRTIKEVLLSIARHYISGTENGVKMDPETGLIFSPAHFTWMDTNYPAATPRQGYPIEIQALWYAATAFLCRIETGKDAAFWKELSAKVKSSIQRLFFLEKKGYLSDCIHASFRQSALSGVTDDALRPNQLLAVTQNAVTGSAIRKKILAACEKLVVPGAIRSLADRPVEYPLEIRHNGALLNDPHHPYWGKYEGDEDTRRKPAYHNGTAWTWLFPSFCEAWVCTYGNKSRQTARAWLASATTLLCKGTAGHVPEITDGDYPHLPRGCDAQAWGASELLRVWNLMAG